MECKICNKEFESLSKHIIRGHKVSYKDYLIKFEYNGIEPLCACGCGNKAPFTRSQGQSFKKYIQGHQMIGRKRSEETKRKIGEKNSINMQEFHKNNPELSKQSVANMRSYITEETEKKRIENTILAYENMPQEDKQKFSERTKQLWENENEKMQEAHKKASETWKERNSNGVYDFTERNEKISESITQKYLDGGFQWSKGHYISTKTGKSIFYRSSYELRAAKELDIDKNVQWWEYEFTVIPYEFNGKKKRYLPDFHVLYTDGTNSLMEVKPLDMRDIERNLAKKEAALKWCLLKNWKYEQYPKY